MILIVTGHNVIVWLLNTLCNNIILSCLCKVQTLTVYCLHVYLPDYCVLARGVQEVS